MAATDGGNLLDFDPLSQQSAMSEDSVGGGGKEEGGGDKYGLTDMKADLKKWRQVTLPLSRLLTWEQPWYPAVLFGFVTLAFLILWYLDLSVLTCVSLAALVVILADFAVPLIAEKFSTQDWTPEKEKEFEIICEKILKLKCCGIKSVQSLQKFKSSTPNGYVVAMVVALGVLAWIGCTFDNLLLTYFLVLAAVLMPGMRHHGIAAKVSTLIKSKINAQKMKSN